MALDIMGLFNTQSVNPYQQQQQAFQQNLMQSTNPQQFVATLGTNIGGQIAGAIPGMFGIKSEEEKKNQAKKEALAEVQSLNIDPTDKLAVGKALVNALQSRGLTAEAMQVGQSLERPKDDSGMSLLTTGKYTPESVSKFIQSKNPSDLVFTEKPKDDGGMSLLTTGKYTPESVAKFQQSKKASDLVLVENKTSNSPSVGINAEFIAQSKFNTSFANLTPEQKQIVYNEAKKETSLGQGLSVLAESLVKSLGTQSGKDVAEAISPKVIQGKENTISALTRAKEILGKGIFTGGLANAKMAISKYTPLGSQQKLENTEKYIAYVSTTVIPLLKEFGGNDSNEELKFLQRLVGGEITLEEETLKEIIDSAITKTERGIERTQNSVKNISKGQLPSTDVTNQSYGDKPKAIGVGETTSVNGTTIKRIK